MEIDHMSAVQARTPKQISHEEFADLLEESEIIDSQDRKSSITHYIQHPKRGFLYLTSSIEDFCTLVEA
jgi:hypothetical protein